MWYFVATMPPKADYWKHFKVVGVVAYCLVAECQQPNISLGALPKPGEKKRLRKQISYDFFKANFILILLTPLPFICVLDVGAVTNHLSRHHEDLWLEYTSQRDAKKNAQAAKKKEERANSEMENPEMRFIDLRSKAGQESFQNQVIFMNFEFK